MCSEMMKSLSKGARYFEKCRMKQIIIVKQNKTKQTIDKTVPQNSIILQQYNIQNFQGLEHHRDSREFDFHSHSRQTESNHHC